MQIIFDITKIANTLNIANIPIVANIDKIANIAIITKVVKIAKNVGIHPNKFGVLNGHPNKIPTSEMLGDVVQNCPLVVSHP